MATPKSNHINYLEFRAKDLESIKAFYTTVFGWEFTDYGDSYVAFENSGLSGGFELTEEEIVNGALVILYHKNLEDCLETVKEAGGQISIPIFSFPGGRRFHFIDPSGNELAVWSE